MLQKTLDKKSKKEAQFIIISLAIVAICGVLFFLSLTFLIKNINLVLKTIAPTKSNLHFNLAEAEKLFPPKKIENFREIPKEGSKEVLEKISE